MSNDIRLDLVDHDAYSSGSDIDSDLESALYSQLHHEPNIAENVAVIPNLPPSANYVNYFSNHVHVNPKNDFEPSLHQNPPRPPDSYHGNSYSTQASFMPNYSAQFKYQPKRRSFRSKRFFDSPLLTDHPRKIQCIEVNNDRILHSREVKPLNDYLDLQDDSNKVTFKEVTNELTLRSSEELTQVEDFIQSHSSEHVSRAVRSKCFESKAKGYELITLSDSSRHPEKNSPRKKHGPPYIQFLLQQADSPGESKKKPHVSCKKRRLVKSQEKVIDISDSPAVVSDATIDLLSSSDEDNILIYEDHSSDIVTNLEGCRPAEKPPLEIQDVLKNMSGNPELWRINERDRFPESYRQTFQYQRQFKLLKVTCLNCRERGHLSRNCNKPRRLIVCFLCGSGGHEASECPLPACGKCMRLGHQVQQCQWPKKSLEKKCPSCKMKGHLREECPDNWRKYHKTTFGSNVITGSSSQHASLKKSCYNCGRPGHLGHKCEKPRMYSYVYPNLPWVVNYNNPSECVGVQNAKKDSQAPKDREKFFMKLYKAKQRLAKASDEKYANLLAKKTSSHRKHFGLKGSKKKWKGKRRNNVTQTVVRDGQIYYPREGGAMGNSGCNLQDKIQVALAKKQKFVKRFQNGAKKFTSRFQTPTWNATGNSFCKTRNK